MSLLDEEILKFFKIIISHIGLIVLGAGISLLIPLLLLLFYPNETNLVLPFLIPAIISIMLGISLWKYFKIEDHPPVERRHTTVMITFGWILAVAFGALPFYLSGEMTYLDGFFEAMSGWTTTGLSMVPNENVFPRLLLFWRSLMQLIGGAGLAVLMLTAIVGSGDIETGLYSSEGKDQRLLPSIVSTARMIVKIYLLYVFIGTIIYVITGMGVFDAVNHSMSAFSTGGFSTKSSSLGAFSVSAQYITLLFMFFGSTNFALHYKLIQGDLKELILDIEPKFFYLFSSIASLIVIGSLRGQGIYSSFSKTFLQSVFQVISALSTTGFMTESAIGTLGWGPLVLVVMVLLMTFGAAASSTGGGLKLVRIGILIKSVFWEIKRQILPKKAVLVRKIRHGGRKVKIDNDIMWNVTTFTVIYILMYLFGVLVFIFEGFSISEALFEYASAQGTVGLSVGVTGPNMPITLKVLEIIGMWLGRLEFWTIFIAIGSVLNDLGE